MFAQKPITYLRAEKIVDSMSILFMAVNYEQ